MKTQKNQKYYLGLDMGTSSVGWAVTDSDYRLIRKKGKDMWGIREFDEAVAAAERRSHRTSRRRRQREVARIGLLKSYFADAVLAVDENFFTRLENSKYFLEDKDENLSSTNGIFDDENYKDKDYYREYPTIFHLRKALLDLDQSGRTFDVRLVYLALLNMFKHRGHFLLSTTEDGLDAVQIGLVYEELLLQLNEEYGIGINSKPVEQMIEIIGDKEIGRKLKYEKMIQLFTVEKNNKKANEFLKCMCGLTVNANTFLEPDSEEKITVCFHDFSYADKIPELMEQLGDNKYAVLEQMKTIYDYAVLAGIQKGYDYLSLARVESYEKHYKDLRLLKGLYRKYKTQEEYDRMFRSEEDGTYSAYVNTSNSTDAITGERKSRRNRKGRKADDLYARIKKDFKNYTEDEEVQYVFNQIEKEQFLTKQLTGENGIIPNQVHKKEMTKILENAEKYLPFLQKKDESGLTISERVLRLFSFQIPYYVGPLGKNCKTGWAVRREEGDVLPWNIQDKIDMQATSEAFIRNLIRECTYIAGEKVLPKSSLAYEKYSVLNEINNIKIDGERIEPKLKQQIFQECFCKGKKVSRKQLCNYLVVQGIIQSADQVTGIDITINNSLASYGKMYAIFGEKLKKDRYIKIAEDIIYWGTIFADSKEMFRQHLLGYVKEGTLTETDSKRILGYKFKDWGRFSRALLELQGCDKSTGEVISLGNAMWEYSLNFMELIHSDCFTFKEALAEKRAKIQTLLSEFEYDDLKDYYFSAPVKRMIWQTILVVREIESVMECAPEKVFVEMTRNDDEKGDRGRKASRGSQLLEIYKNIKNTETHNWKEEISAADGNGRLKSKKLYLYYTQMGRDMYTGEEIDLNRLFDDNLYDIDHIYPRHYVKDDSIVNNLVLVNKSANEHLKKDIYPIPEKITSNSKVRELWEMLHGHKLISDEKYSRLVSKTAFTEKQMGDFIARQLVETGQGTKGVAELLQQLMSDTRIVYAKASNVSEFRNKNGFVKSRLVNEFHHANDAYLNIVVGNVYDVKFTQNPWNFIEKEYAKDKKKNHYNLDKMFAWDVVRGEEVAWIAKNGAQEGTIDTVRKMLWKNTPLMTRMSFEKHGEIAKATLYSAQKIKENPHNYISLKTQDKRMGDVTKYGGYTAVKIAYFFVVEHQEGKKKSISIEGMPIYCKDMVENTENGLKKYCSDQLGYNNVRVLCKKLKVQSLLEVDGYRMHLSGKTGNQLTMRNAVNMCLPENVTHYIKKIEKYVETTVLEDVLCKTQNEKIYEILTEKHIQTIYSKRLNPVGQKLQRAREKFQDLSMEDQCAVLYQILQLSKIDLTSADLTLIGESGRTGVMQMNKNIKQPEKIKIIDQSVTGLYERKRRLTELEV